jgi:hypothetical protein
LTRQLHTTKLSDRSSILTFFSGFVFVFSRLTILLALATLAGCAPIAKLPARSPATPEPRNAPPNVAEVDVIVEPLPGLLGTD